MILVYRQIQEMQLNHCHSKVSEVVINEHKMKLYMHLSNEFLVVFVLPPMY